MSKEHLEEDCEDYLGGLLPEPEMRRWREHVSVCGQCRSDLKAIAAVTHGLRHLEPPPLSPGFLGELRRRVLTHPVTAKPVSRPRRLILEFPEALASFFRRPLGGLALAATAAVALLALFQPQFEKIWNPMSRSERDIRIEVAEVRNPIVLAAADAPAAAAAVKSYLLSHQGRVIESRAAAGGTRLVVSVADENAFFATLDTIGKVSRGATGYRDQQGNIVIVIRTAPEQPNEKQ